MQNRRIIDSVFRSIGVTPRPVFETNSIINLCTQVGSGLWSSVIPRQLLGAFELPAGVEALPLVEPVARRLVGLVAPDREPQAALTVAFMALAPAFSEEERGVAG